MVKMKYYVFVIILIACMIFNMKSKVNAAENDQPTLYIWDEDEPEQLEDKSKYQSTKSN